MTPDELRQAATTTHPAIHGVPCAACEASNAAFLLPSGAPVCGDCFLNLASPEIMRQNTERLA
jgi:hypothetical protein